MNNDSVKRAVVTLFALSYYMLYALLLVIIEPHTVVKILLMLPFAFIAHGLQLFLTIGTEKKPAPFKVLDIGTFGMMMPAIIYLILGIFNFADLRGTLVMTAVTAFFTLLFDSFLEGVSGRRRAFDTDKDNKDDNDKDGKGD